MSEDPMGELVDTTEGQLVMPFYLVCDDLGAVAGKG